MLSLGIPLGLGQVVGLATLPSVFGWYIPKLRKPRWAPSAPIFGQVRSGPMQCLALRGKRLRVPLQLLGVITTPCRKLHSVLATLHTGGVSSRGGRSAAVPLGQGLSDTQCAHSAGPQHWMCCMHKQYRSRATMLQMQGLVNHLLNHGLRG